MEASNMSVSSSNPHASVGKVSGSHTRKVARIADKIVDLVERTDGPVLLNEIQKRVPDFKAPPGPNWCYFIRHNGGETVIWNGMTEAGHDALRRVLNERRVALQCVTVLPYLYEGLVITDPEWQPVVLLPVRAANIDGQNWAERVSPTARYWMLGPAGTGRFRPRLSQPIRFTADQFCIH
jgi:hypothetical protein